MNYLWRAAGTYDVGWRAASQYHKIQADGKTSLCGAAEAGVQGYAIKEIDGRILDSRICHNCLINRVVRQKEDTTWTKLIDT